MSQTQSTAISDRSAVLLLAMMLGIQPITSDLYLPALPALTQEFGATMSHAQLTLSAMLLAFGVSQMFWGPLSDRWGRKPVLLTGLCIYSLAAVFCVLASSIDILIFWRSVQGAAMGAVVMCGRAIVRDLYKPDRGARVMSKALTGLGLIACVSAPIGAWLTERYSWHVALSTLVVFGLASIFCVLFFYKETIQRKNKFALQWRVMLKTWWRILKNPVFVAFTCLSIGSFGGLFTFLVTSSFVFIQLVGLSRIEYGWVMGSMSFAYIGGTFLCRRLLPSFGVQGTVAIGGALTLAGGLLMNVSALMGWNTVLGLVGPFYLFVIAHGIHQPCGQSGAVGPFPKAAGAASALGGFLMMAVAFLMGLWLGEHADGTVFPLVHGVVFWAVATSLSAWILVRRYGAPRV